MESLRAPTRSFTALIVFCLALSPFLLPQVKSQDIMGSGGDAFSPLAAQAFTPPLPSVEDPAAPSAAPIVAPVTPSVEDPAAPSAAPILAPAVTVPSVEDPAAPSIAPATLTPSGTIKRVTKQHILATIPAGPGAASEPFISSPSGKYTGYLLRRETAPGAGGFGNDFCYIQVRDTSSGHSVWESDCAPASLANACTLMFTTAGLEVFDGSRSTWDAGVDDGHLETLELVDEGDMRIRTRDGELAWKASDSPLANQRCGMPGSPGLSSALPPFAAPVEDSRNLPFGLPSQGIQQQPQEPGTVFNQQPLAGAVQPVGVQSGEQPLVDNTPFDSAGWRAVESWFKLASALALGLMGCGFLF
ncbi:hypothetical protein Taro_008780 [Colocasia esculenta]|uniref:Uncharacterized protein n=1 Tax=Colocasia esculenta TaxID=4460 RepID=A0A843U391_COLES|nr:hypothetical protein [Colocasia esculenta]